MAIELSQGFKHLLVYVPLMMCLYSIKLLSCLLTTIITVELYLSSLPLPE